ncbi:MAG: ATP-dependent metallopeptidase FtsH/Yme1/Tma family protein [bacterium]|nr:ATP-dependent metallopeptidase FtsH/Yme1/Tma family protein [bacterium]
MLVFVAAAGLFLFSANHKKTENLDQSAFESALIQKKISTVVMTPSTGNIMSVQGKLKNKTKTGTLDYSSRIIYTNTLDKLLRDTKDGSYKVNVTIKNDDSWFKSLIYMLLIILVPVGLLYMLFARQIKGAGKGAMQFGKSKARMIFPDKNKIKFSDVAGADEAKEETKEIMDYLNDPLKFKLLGAKIPKGAMLVGPPGTGKTMLAKAIAGEANVPFFAISGSDFVEMFVGVGASRVRDMFATARKHAPCLIFIDEIDAVGRSRFSGIGGGHDEREQTLNAMLVEMDGLETEEGGVIVLAATNRPDVLDPALVRPGRFDRQIALDLPDIKGRRQILEVHAKNIKMSKDVDLNVVAKGTPGFSGADLANLINEAALLAARVNKTAAEMPELEEARDKVCWGRERRSKKISEKERRITAYHEAGHTLTGLYCENSTPLHKVTIIPRGIAYLGATFQLAEEDRYTQSKKELEDMMIMMMGGRSAEEITFGDITSGAAGDIGEATKVAKKMVCVFGMSEKMGEIAYGGRSEQVYVGRDITRSEDYSEDTAREIDLEIKKLISTAKKKSDEILTKHKDQLELLAQELLKKETLLAKEVKILLGFEVSEEDDSFSEKAKASAKAEVKSATKQDMMAELKAEIKAEMKAEAEAEKTSKVELKEKEVVEKSSTEVIKKDNSDSE